MCKTSQTNSDKMNLTYSNTKQVGDIAKDLLLLIQMEATKTKKANPRSSKRIDKKLRNF